MMMMMLMMMMMTMMMMMVMMMMVMMMMMMMMIKMMMIMMMMVMMTCTVQYVNSKRPGRDQSPNGLPMLLRGSPHYSRGLRLAPPPGSNKYCVGRHTHQNWSEMQPQSATLWLSFSPFGLSVLTSTLYLQVETPML